MLSRATFGVLDEWLAYQWYAVARAGSDVEAQPDTSFSKNDS